MENDVVEKSEKMIQTLRTSLLLTKMVKEPFFS